MFGNPFTRNNPKKNCYEVLCRKYYKRVNFSSNIVLTQSSLVENSINVQNDQKLNFMFQSAKRLHNQRTSPISHPNLLLKENRKSNMLQSKPMQKLSQKPSDESASDIFKKDEPLSEKSSDAKSNSYGHRAKKVKTSRFSLNNKFRLSINLKNQ